MKNNTYLLSAEALVGDLIIFEETCITKSPFDLEVVEREFLTRLMIENMTDLLLIRIKESKLLTIEDYYNVVLG